MGWTAATGRLDAGAAILFGILFVWQIPHFLALAWMYRDEYGKAGYRMLPVVDTDGLFTARTSLVYAVVLLPLSALVWVEGLSGTAFLVGSQVVGLAFVAAAIPFVLSNRRRAARRLFLASILYLPILLGLMVGDMDDRVRRGAFLDAEADAPAGQQVLAIASSDQDRP
jgi:protoheme IX farnesyltransferase